MALSADQVYLLNTLTYISKDRVYSAQEGQDVKSFVQTLVNSESMRNRLADDLMTADQILDVCEKIARDEALCEMTIAYADRTPGGADRLIFVSETEEQAVIALEGTMGAEEWRDDARGAGPTTTDDKVSTQHQMDDLAWFQGKEVQDILGDYDHVTISGHSKGGNKAKYITVMDDRVDECISFDGQGFSDEFMEKYEAEIRKNQGKITNYNNANDYVSILLNDIGDIKHVEGEDTDGNFMLHHSLFTMRDSLPLREQDAEQNWLLKEADELLNGYLRTLDPAERQAFAEFFGEALALCVSGDYKLDKGESTISMLGKLGIFGLDNLKGFLYYALTYASYEFTEAMLRQLKEYFPWLEGWIDQMIEAVERKPGMPNGGDIVVHGSDRIEVDTNQMDRLSADLRRLSSALEGCRAEINSAAAMCDDFHIGIRISLAISLVLTRGIRGLFGGTPAQTLNELGRDVQSLSDEVEKLSARVQKAAEMFEENENEIISSLPATEGVSSPWAR